MITLIATGHYEKGICTSDELGKIIEQISPDVIFEEVPPNIFQDLHKGLLCDSLETKAIKMYLQIHPIDHFPVDLNRESITYDFFTSDYNAMSSIFKYHSSEYSNLSNHWGYLPGQFGFPYLNSRQCKEFLERKRFLENVLVQTLNHEKLSNRHKDWTNFNDERESEMIRNIYNYCKLDKYKNALFLVGAEHKKPIMDKIPEFEKKNQVQLDWNFNYFK